MVSLFQEDYLVNYKPFVEGRRTTHMHTNLKGLFRVNIDSGVSKKFGSFTLHIQCISKSYKLKKM